MKDEVKRHVTLIDNFKHTDLTDKIAILNYLSYSLNNNSDLEASPINSWRKAYEEFSEL